MCELTKHPSFVDFDLDAFEGWLQKKKTGWIQWDQASRLRMVVYVMKTREYDTVYDIQNYDFKNTKIGDFNKAYYDKRFVAKDGLGKHQNMIISALEDAGIACDRAKFMIGSAGARRMLVKEYGAALERCPVYEVSNELVEKKNRFVEQLKTVPEIVGNIAELVVPTESVGKCGCVYVMTERATGRILYVGSTDDILTRVKGHKRAFDNPEYGCKHSTKLYNTLRSNYADFDAVDMRVITMCETGFEKLLESAIYKGLLKTGYDLLNSYKPTKYNVDHLSFIYQFIDTLSNTIMYVGSTNNFYKRVTKHQLYCYSPNLNEYTTECYKQMRKIDDQKWPDHVKIQPIEKCPIYVVRQREQHYMSKFHTIANGINTSIAEKTSETESARIDKNNDKRRTKVKCSICNKEINQSSLKRHIQLKHKPSAN